MSDTRHFVKKRGMSGKDPRKGLHLVVSGNHQRNCPHAARIHDTDPRNWVRTIDSHLEVDPMATKFCQWPVSSTV